MKSIKIFRELLCCLCLLFIGQLYAQQKLNMYIDHNRFKDSEGSTILQIDYQIPYKNLTFLAHQGIFFAEVSVSVEIAQLDSVVYTYEVKDNIGVSNKVDTQSMNKSYLNRISFKLDDPPYMMTFKATDLLSNNEFSWMFRAEELDQNLRLSDIELNTYQGAESSDFSKKFLRDGIHYIPNPSVLFNKNQHDNAYLYLELYTDESELNMNNSLCFGLERDSTVIYDETISFTPQNTTEKITFKIPLQDLVSGKYKGYITLLLEETSEVKSFEFVLSEDVEQEYRLFSDSDDELKLMKYFSATRIPNDWANLDPRTKSKYITNFWKNLSMSLRLSVEDTIELIHQRIEYSNKHFSHFKPGWTTDIGRVYIRNGAPEDITKKETSDVGKFVRKDYQIWKYAKGNRPVYMFIDMQMNKNYRLIYADGDDSEPTNPDWLSYVGSDFDTSLLRN